MAISGFYFPESRYLGCEYMYNENNFQVKLVSCINQNLFFTFDECTYLLSRVMKSLVCFN